VAELLSPWLHHFLVPLVAGGDVRVSRPFGALERRQLCDEAVATDDERSRALGEARQSVAAEILVSPKEPQLDDETVDFGIAVNNLLFLSHPAASGSLVRKSKLARVAEWSVNLVESHGPPEDAAHLVARHTLLQHLFDLGRDDVRVSFWAGRRDFRGSEPPSRLYRWGKMRRVREERTRVQLVGEFLNDQGHRQQALLEALLHASPLTDLLDPVRGEPTLDFEGSARWLAEPLIARAVADRWLALGLSQIAQPATNALLALCQRKKVSVEARLSTEFLCHLQLLGLLSRRGTTDVDRLRTEMFSQAQTQPAMRELFGVFAAAGILGLQRPGDLGRDARLLRLVDDYAAVCATVVGQPRILELQAALARGTHAMLEAAS